MFAKYLILLLPLFMFCSCIEPPSTKTSFEKERDQRVHSALKNFIRSMQAKGYHAGGIGEGLDHSTGKQKYLGVTFNVEHLPDIDTARKLEIEALQEFLKFINEEEGIEDYVAEYPYPLKFVRIAFLSRNSETGLFSVANFEETLAYRKDNPEQPIGPTIEVHEETYDEALKALAKK